MWKLSPTAISSTILALESIKVMDLLMMLEDRFDISIPINILLDVKTPAQLMETLLPWLENK